MKQVSNDFKGQFPKKKSGKNLVNKTIKKKVRLYQTADDFGIVAGLTFGAALFATLVSGLVHVFSSIEVGLLFNISLGFVATAFIFLSSVTYVDAYGDAILSTGNNKSQKLKSSKALSTSFLKLPMKKKEILISKSYIRDDEIPNDSKTLIKAKSSDLSSIFKSPYEMKTYQVQTWSGIRIEQRIEPTTLALWDNTLAETKDLHNLELLINDSAKYLEMESKKR